ncbi:MAG: response regulator [Sphingomonadales bacterium]|nr:response regulator [Sphingomonadales bacterium]
MPKALLIDDNPSILNLMRDILIDSGMDVYTAKDGEEGSRMLNELEPDILVTDIFMPNRDGLELLREIRNTHKSLKVMVITGNGNDYSADYLQMSKYLGADALMHKPFDLDKFSRSVNELLNMDVVH